ncbi:MAG: FUSC family protein [Actinobacteria bacterium]|nr:FUSC family protein [Actinomycetota bacterium]
MSVHRDILDVRHLLDTGRVGRAMRQLIAGQQWVPLLITTSRLTTAAVISYLLTLWLTDGPIDLTCSLTAILVVQTSAYSTVRMGMVRVGAVLTGVLVAVVLSSWVGLTWWSLAIAIAASLLLAAILRLGEQALETPISAMLILAIGGQDIGTETRVVTTLIGAGVGIAFNLLLPPPVPNRQAIGMVRGVARQQADCLRRAGESMAAGPVTRGEVEARLDQARSINKVAEQASLKVQAVKDVRRLNARAIGTPEIEPVLRTGLEALDHSLFAIRALFVAMRKDAPEQLTPDDGYGEEVRPAFAVVLANVADCLDAFGAMIEAEAEQSDEEVERNLGESLEVAREARAILTDLLMVDPKTETSLWMLRGSTLVAVEQVLAPLRLEDRSRVRREQKRSAGAQLAATTLLLRDMLPSPAMPRLLPAAAREELTAGKAARRKVRRLRRGVTRRPRR